MISRGKTDTDTLTEESGQQSVGRYVSRRLTNDPCKHEEWDELNGEKRDHCFQRQSTVIDEKLATPRDTW